MAGQQRAPDASSPLDTDTQVDRDGQDHVQALRVTSWFGATSPIRVTLKVTKALSRARHRLGQFNLLIDGQTGRLLHVGDGARPGSRPSLPAPTRWLRQPARRATSPTYDSTTSCVDKAHQAADTDGSVQVAKADAWECVITNTRKSSPPPPR